MCTGGNKKPPSRLMRGWRISCDGSAAFTIQAGWLRRTDFTRYLSSSRTCLPELAPVTRQSHHCAWSVGLPRLRRAGPSASLDKSVYSIVGRMVHDEGRDVKRGGAAASGIPMNSWLNVAVGMEAMNCVQSPSRKLPLNLIPEQDWQPEQTTHANGRPLSKAQLDQICPSVTDWRYPHVRANQV